MRCYPQPDGHARKVVFVAHSNGNHVLSHLFTRTVPKAVGSRDATQAWLKTHVAAWMSVAAPHLGCGAVFSGVLAGGELGTIPHETYARAFTVAQGRLPAPPLTRVHAHAPLQSSSAPGLPPRGCCPARSTGSRASRTTRTRSP